MLVRARKLFWINNSENNMDLLQETKPFFPGTASLIENLDRKL